MSISSAAFLGLVASLFLSSAFALVLPWNNPYGSAQQTSVGFSTTQINSNWNISTEFGAVLNMAVVGSKVYTITVAKASGRQGGTKLLVQDLASGKILNTAPLLNTFTSCDSSCFITVDLNGYIYYVYGGQFIRIEPVGYTVDWRLTFPVQPGYANVFIPVVSSRGDFVILGSNTGVIYRYEAKASTASWSLKVVKGSATSSSTITLSPDETTAYLTGFDYSNLIAVDVQSGKIKWINTDAPSSSANIAVSANGKLLAASSRFEFHVYDSSTGVLLWNVSFATQKIVLSSIPAFDASDNVIVTGHSISPTSPADSAILFILSTRTRKIMNVSDIIHPNFDQGPIVFNDQVVIPGSPNPAQPKNTTFFVIDANTGAVTSTWTTTWAWTAIGVSTTEGNYILAGLSTGWPDYSVAMTVMSVPKSASLLSS